MNGATLRTLLAYGAVAGVVLLCLKLISLSPLAFDWGRELMAAAVALAGVAVGVWRYRRRTPRSDAQPLTLPESAPADAASAPAVDAAAVLSMREREVLALLAGGLSNKELARRLNVSENTIKTHLANVYGKLGVEGRVQAVMAAQRLGMQPSPAAAHPKFTRPGDGSSAIG